MRQTVNSYRVVTWVAKDNFCDAARSRVACNGRQRVVHQRQTESREFMEASMPSYP